MDWYELNGAVYDYVLILSSTIHLWVFQEPLPTPRIDTVLESYRQKASSTDDGSGCALKQPDYDGRLLQLEKQLTSLLHKTKV